MSSILKALRKLEDEKAEIGEGSVDLARDILKRSYEEKKLPLLGILLSVGFLLVLLILAWLALTLSSSEKVPVVTAPASQPKPEAPILINPAKVSPSASVEPLLVIPQDPPGQQQQASRSSLAMKPDTTQLPKANIAPAVIIPILQIEEIVYTADPAARLAVINDLPVMEGTDIEGARIVEILPDRVRFVFQGLEFSKFAAENHQ